MSKWGRMTDKKAKQLLNDYYSDCLTSDQAVQKLLYLTNTSRKPHTTTYRLRMAYRNRTLGNTLARLDPIAFNSAKYDLL